MDQHYLQAELYHLVQTDPSVLDFLEHACADGIWYWDLDSPEDEWMSPSFWRLFGYEPHEKPHKASAWQDMIHPDDLPHCLANFEHHCADAEHPYDQLVRYRHKDGSTVWVRCRGLATRDLDGRAIRMLGAHQDVTRAKRIEAELERKVAELETTQEELRVTNRALERSNMELERLAHIASHDLREPLRTISSYLQLLEMELGDDLGQDARRYIGYVVQAAARQLTMVDSLRSYSEVRDHAFQLEAVDCGRLLDDVLESLTPYIDQTSATVTRDPMPTVIADANLLRHVFHNLIGNGLTFSRRAPLIHVGVTRTGRGYTFTIRDNGIGFDPKYATRIFGFFERLHGVGRFTGAGIGLALCRRIIEDHGGRIWATSEPDVGTIVSFTLPHPSPPP